MGEEFVNSWTLKLAIRSAVVRSRIASRVGKIRSLPGIGVLIDSAKSSKTVLKMSTNEFKKLSFSQLQEMFENKIAVSATVRKNVVTPLGALMRKTYLLGEGGFGQWRYITAGFVTQLLAESIARGQDLFDPNPIVMGENYLSDKDLWQNMGYMTTETFLMASASTPNRSLTRRMAICGMIGGVDSTVMNIAFKGDLDAGRITADTAWEVVVGNAQVQLDLAAIRTFENLATRSGRGKIRLVGYAIAVVDQFVGYFGYSQITQAYEKNAKKTDQAATDPNLLDDTSLDISKLRVVLRPVYVPDDQ